MKRLALLILPLLVAWVLVALWFLGLAPEEAVAAQSARAAAPDGFFVHDAEFRRLHPALLRHLGTAGGQERIAVLVELARPAEFLQGLTLPGDEVGMRAGLIAALVEESVQASRPVLAEIAAHGGVEEVRVFWISPVIALRASPGLIVALSRVEGVVQIRLDEPMRIAALMPSGGEPSPGAGMTANLLQIGLDLVQPALGLDGRGVVIANLDSGVDWTHPALQASYRGYDPAGAHQHEGNWHDSTGQGFPMPVDPFGHGTHTMGIMVGREAGGLQVGVAPGAHWIAVRMIDGQGFFFESWAHDAFEWILAPNGDPALAPDVVNASWSTNFYGDARFQPDVQALRLGGILPVFSAGNRGPFVTTIGSPADYPESLAAGAVEDAGLVTTFSGRGPSTFPWNESKPELVAPGVDVISAIPGGNYLDADGTSMAAPHVAAAAALLLQAAPDLSPDELEEILTQVATPLLPPTPNNDSGWGLLNVYAAAVFVTPHGEISGTVRSVHGTPLPHPVLTATHISGAPVVVIAGDADGRYHVALAPGTYTLAASAFAYGQVSRSFVQIRNNMQLHIDFGLERLPVGAVFGTVADKTTGERITATLSLRGTGHSIPTNALGGYALALPAGVWTMDVSAMGYRIGHTTITATVGMTQELHIRLVPAPSILLVDAGRWYYGSKLGYYTAALSGLDYVYDVQNVRDPYGVVTGVEDKPRLSDLQPYDVVIWSSPQDSPGLIRAGTVVSEYLSLGGKVLVSGQDVAFWDGGGNLFVLPNYFPAYARAWYESEQVRTLAAGAPGSVLEDILLVMNTPDSDMAQFMPDTVEVADALVAQHGMEWSDGSPAVLLSGGCHAYRLAWTAFGLEGSGPESQRVAAFTALLDWMAAPPPEYGVSLSDVPPALIGAAGETVTHVVTIHNTGTRMQDFAIEVRENRWPVWVQLPDGTVFSGDGEMRVPACSNQAITVTVDIPAGLPLNVFDQPVLTVNSKAAPGVSASVPLLAKTPAPVLLLDDGLWVWYGGRYAEALASLGLAFDYVNTEAETLQENILLKYPLVVWTTGQDWFYSIQPAERKMMMEYMQAGGRLLLSSQDFLNNSGSSVFVRSYLGIIHADLEITPTVAVQTTFATQGKAGELWRLDYPFVNWSDGFVPAEGVMPVLLDDAMRVIGVASRPSIAPDGRALFFSFPLEALPADGLRQILMDGTLWLGPFGGSSLQTDGLAFAGASVPLTLTLVPAAPSPLRGLSAVVNLPEEAQVDPTAIAGPWTYHPPSHSLNWSGTLTPGVTVTLAARLDLAGGILPGTSLPVTAAFRTARDETFTSEAFIRVDVPLVDIRKTVSPDQVLPSSPVVEFRLVAANSGLAPATAAFTDTLPVPLDLFTGTLRATSGTVSAQAGEILWSGTIDPGAAVTVTYQAGLQFPQPMGNLVGLVEVWDGFVRRGDWASLFVPGGLFFPFVGR